MQASSEALCGPGNGPRHSVPGLRLPKKGKHSLRHGILSPRKPGRSSRSRDSCWPQGSTERTFYSQAAGGSDLSEKPVNVLDAFPGSAQRHKQYVPTFPFWGASLVSEVHQGTWRAVLIWTKGPSVRLLGSRRERGSMNVYRKNHGLEANQATGV